MNARHGWLWTAPVLIARLHAGAAEQHAPKATEENALVAKRIFMAIAFDPFRAKELFASLI